LPKQLFDTLAQTMQRIASDRTDPLPDSAVSLCERTPIQCRSRSGCMLDERLRYATQAGAWPGLLARPDHGRTSTTALTHAAAQPSPPQDATVLLQESRYEVYPSHVSRVRQDRAICVTHRVICVLAACPSVTGACEGRRADVLNTPDRVQTHREGYGGSCPDATRRMPSTTSIAASMSVRRGMSSQYRKRGETLEQCTGKLPASSMVWPVAPGRCRGRQPAAGAGR
jgi:hypothetical protein